ncbi:hypothetical protein [Agrilutibacter terrestris]|nr:hypothetical protein [Lysobacter terrestris]
MILNSMLSNSPVFLFCLSGLLLGAYGAARLVQAGLRLGRRMLSH